MSGLIRCLRSHVFALKIHCIRNQIKHWFVGTLLLSAHAWRKPARHIGFVFDHPTLIKSTPGIGKACTNTFEFFLIR